MQPHFDLRQEMLEEPSALITISGDFDIGGAPRFRAAVGEVMGQGRRRIVVDLARAEFIDSSGLGALLWAARRLRAVGGDLVAVNVTGAVDRTMALTRIDDVIAVERVQDSVALPMNRSVSRRSEAAPPQPGG
jgi:anti-sigma B factor antagonist